MAFQWQSKTGQATTGVEDMVLLSKVTDSQIVENLYKRYNADLIYTYIGPVLIALNPYKSLNYFTEKEIELYHGSAAHENAPHIYAVAESMFQHMLTDEENQCCIISGESGSGKTESSKLLMGYIAAVSGKGGSQVEETKRIILESNPLLEAFGNAKTLRNNNSSRFGKYFEINFTRGGQPFGGNISNFLLEKSRVVSIKPGERNFHIFYQLLKGSNQQEKQQYALAAPDYFQYLVQSKTYDVDHVDDAADFAEVKTAMGVCGISQQEQVALLQITAGVLHLGNIQFYEQGNVAVVSDPNALQYPAYLLGIDAETLRAKLTSRLMTTGGKQSALDVTLNVQQANNSRDALAKALYSRMFDWIIQAVNKAIDKNHTKDKVLSLGVLDIYGFEIFEKNGFEQLCINYVNEKLQQVFIELTLKSEQEEYVKEGIQWTPIEYFNNKVVVDLIEGKRPAGIMPILDDICLQLHAVTDGADEKFVQKLDTTIGSHQHYNGAGRVFMVKHYAGSVTYDCHGFCEANKDTLYRDLILLMQMTNNPFIRNLFPEDVAADDKKRPTTAGFKIRNQGNNLVETLMKCTPSYVRCIKPNEKKKPKDWESNRVEHQVRYLNLRENINVRRAGFCYRNIYEKFLRRYAILTPQTFPHWNGNPADGVQLILRSSGLAQNQWQLGRTKIFIKAPESLFMLEELRERQYDQYARTIQRAYRRYKSRKFYLEAKKKMLSLFVGRKERRRITLNREYIGDYLDTISNPVIKMLVGKATILYCNSVLKYDRRWKPYDRDLVLTDQHLFIIGLEKIASGPEKGNMQKVVKRKLPIESIFAVSVTTLSDNFVVVHVKDEYDNVFEDVFKTELVTVMADTYQKRVGRPLPIQFQDTIQYSVKKTTWDRGGQRTLTAVYDQKGGAVVKVVSNSSSSTTVGVPPGLPRDSQPQVRMQQQQFRSTQAQRGPAPQRPAMNVSSYNAPAIPAPVVNGGGGGGMPQMPQQMRPQLPTSRPPAVAVAAPASQAHYRPPAGLHAPPPASLPSRPPMQIPQQQGGAVRKNSAAQMGMGGIAIQSLPSLAPPQSGAVRPSMPPQNAPSFGRPAPANMNASFGRPPVGNVGAGMQQQQQFQQQQQYQQQQQLGQSMNGLGVKNRPPPPAVAPPKPKQMQYKALYTYQAKEADELGFNVGDVITIINKDNEGWWTGLANGRKGLVPSNYVSPM
ncbi:hypothetical protein MP228_008091 [Amoeboaphelidium protococcarum]|nr:hypothetical protein MP228_008091 [Amoeboaphelidium protococcarum]